MKLLFACLLGNTFFSDTNKAERLCHSLKSLESVMWIRQLEPLSSSKTFGFLHECLRMSFGFERRRAKAHTHKVLERRHTAKQRELFANSTCGRARRNKFQMKGELAEIVYYFQYASLLKASWQELREQN